ncbi:MAG: hypothetical protein RR424_01035 [Oscillospiraceae bacterium]
MAKQNAYTSLAISRANFFTKGSPVQYVQTELIREEASGNTLVTLSFINLYQRLLTQCAIHFTCKNTLGALLAEDDFVYDGISVPEGEIFGSDDAVFISNEEIGAVEVSLVSITFENNRAHDMTNYEKIKLPALRLLREEAKAVLYDTLRSDVLHYRPNQIEEGWQCTCGAFNYNAGHGFAVCNECGMDKTMLFGAMRELESQSAAPIGGTKMFSPVTKQQIATEKSSGTRMFTPPTSQQNVSSRTRTQTKAISIMSDDTARFITKFVPFIAAGASLIYILGALAIKTILF